MENAIDKKQSDTVYLQDCIEKLKAFPDTFGSAENRASSKLRYIYLFILNSGKGASRKSCECARVYGSLGVLFGALAVIVLF